MHFEKFAEVRASGDLTSWRHVEEALARHRAVACSVHEGRVVKDLFPRLKFLAATRRLKNESARERASVHWRRRAEVSRLRNAYLDTSEFRLQRWTSLIIVFDH